MTDPRTPVPSATFRSHFVEGAFLEIVGGPPETYRVEFVDTATGAVVHRDRIAPDHWVRTARRYATDWRIDVYRGDENEPVFSQRYWCRGRRVYVALESKALGDSVAWIPAIDAFRRRRGCEVICSTFMNDLFRDRYPHLAFVEPGTAVEDLYAMYRIGWFYRDDGTLDLDRNVRDVRQQPLGETAADILGIPFVEERPRIRRVAGAAAVAGPYVCIAIHATAQAKYWNNPRGWPEVVEYLRGRGFTVVLLSSEGLEHMGNLAPAGVVPVPPGPIDEILRLLQGASLFIGVGSGLSWLAWAVGCRVCLISGFSAPFTEMRDCLRVAPAAGICAGCFNTHRLDPGDWNWCPVHGDSPRMFECTRTITPEQVIETIAAVL